MHTIGVRASVVGVIAGWLLVGAGLATAGNISYRYDGNGRLQRVEVSETTNASDAGVDYVRDAAGNLVLRESPSGPDATLRVTAQPEALVFGNLTTFAVTVSNIGTSAIDDVEVSFGLSTTSYTLVSLTSSEGSCTAATVLCDVGTLAPSESAYLTLSLVPQVLGEVTLLGTVATAPVSEVTLENNTAQAVVTLVDSGDPADADGDGIPDTAEVAFGFDANFAPDALADADNDGVSNLDEYLAGTNPNFNVALLGLAVTKLLRPAPLAP